MINSRWILTVVLLAFGTIAAMLPEKTNRSAQLNAEELLREILSETYVVSTDELADLLIQKDPSILLIDVRSPAEYAAFTLPGAVNIPFDSLLNEDWGGYLDQEVKRNIFFSNGTTLSSRAWVLTKQLGYPNNYFLEGGLNEWFATIIEPQPPATTASEEAFRQYQTRLAASQYFTGKSGQSVSTQKAKPLKPIKRRKKKMVQGGCS